MNDVLPPALFSRIQNHLREKSNSAHEGWESANEDEDSLTGDFGGMLRRRCETVLDANGTAWRWRVTYKKFRGRGTGATEKQVGADGIVQVEIEDIFTGTTLTKGLLFQAKTVNSQSNAKLKTQVKRMEELVRNGSAVFEYGPRQYRGMDTKRAPNDKDGLAQTDGNANGLGDYLADKFLPCTVGRRGLSYDAVRKVLYVPDETEGVIKVRIRLKHRVRIEVRREAGA